MGPLPKKTRQNRLKKKPAAEVSQEASSSDATHVVPDSISVPNSDVVPGSEEEASLKVPSKGYNLDLLDKLDDPNFNPFETKTAVVNNFDDAVPETTVNVDNSKATIKDVVKEEDAS